MLGNILASGNIITNNGNIYASGGAIVSATYLGIRGFPVDTNEVSINTYNPTDTAGLWYDGSNGNKLLRTWNISNDNNTVRLGTYQLALINGDNSSIGLRNNNNVLEARNIPNDNTYVDFKARNIYATAGLNVIGETILHNQATLKGDTFIDGLLVSTKDVFMEKDVEIDGALTIGGALTVDGIVNLNNTCKFADAIIEKLKMNGDILPGQTKKYNLGSPS